MNFRKKIVLGVIILTVFIIAAIVVYETNEARLRAENPMHDLAKIIAKGQVDDLSLSIYYMSPFILTSAPLKAEDLVNGGDIVFKIVIDGGELEECADSLIALANTDLMFVKETSSMDARLYYVFKIKNRSILEVVWSDGDSIFVNKSEIKANSIFFRIIIPFLPEEASQELTTYLKLKAPTMIDDL